MLSSYSTSAIIGTAGGIIVSAFTQNYNSAISTHADPIPLAQMYQSGSEISSAISIGRYAYNTNDATHESYIEAITLFYGALGSKQQLLGNDFEAALNENLNKLYEE